MEETRVDVTIGDDEASGKQAARKERPIWMVESTVMASNPTEVHTVILVI